MYALANSAAGQAVNESFVGHFCKQDKTCYLTHHHIFNKRLLK
jgi:hypothetical protein